MANSLCKSYINAPKFEGYISMIFIGYILCNNKYHNIND